MGFGISASFLNLIGQAIINKDGAGRTIITPNNDAFYPAEIANKVKI